MARRWKIISQYLFDQLVQKTGGHFFGNNTSVADNMSHFQSRCRSGSEEKTLLAGTQEWPLEELTGYKYTTRQLTIIIKRQL